MRVLITGSTGFLGTHLSALIQSTWPEAEVVGLTRKEHGSLLFSDREALKKFYPHFDIIFHLAARIPYGQMNQEMPEVTAVDTGLTNWLTSQYPGSRLVYASSVATYGSPDSQPINISTPAVQPTFYGQSKRHAEQLVEAHGRYAIVRFSSLIGKGMTAPTLVNQWVGQAKNQEQLAIYGDGARRQNYLDVRDAARLLLICAMYQENIITLGVGQGSYTNLEVAQEIRKYTQSEMVFVGEDASRSWLYDPKETYDLLNFLPEYDLQDTIKWIMA